MKSNDFYNSFNIIFSKKDKRYIKVLIFRNVIAMRMFYEEQCKLSGIDYDDDFRAMFQPFEIIKIDKSGNEKKLNKIGNMLLYEKDLGSGLISHECGHAVLHYWCLLKGGKSIVNMDEEEEFLHYLGYLVAQFWDNYYKNFK